MANRWLCHIYAQYNERGGTDGAGWPGELCCLEGGVDRDDAVAGQGSGSRGITVNAVAPGYIETAMTAVMDEKQRSAIMATIPLGRAGTDVEIAELVAFLSIGGCWIHHRARAGCERGMFMGRSFPAHPAAFCSKSRKPAICSASAVERLHMLGLWHGG